MQVVGPSLRPKIQRGSARTRLAPSACALAIALVAARGCGYGHPPLLGDSPADGGRGGDNFDFDATFAPPKCEVVTPDGGVCGCTDVPLLTDAPNLYFVLDRSGSMAEDNKWTTVRTVVGKLITAIGPRATFGAAIFPNPNRDDCSAGGEVLAPRRGDAPAGHAGYTNAALLSTTNVPAQGGTPTAATLRAIKSRLTSLRGRTYVILATDGGPNCNARTSCGVEACIPNIESGVSGCSPSTPPNCCDAQHFGPASCLDAQPTIDAVNDLHASGIDTYVVGVPGSGPYATILDDLASAGHTARSARPYYYRVDSADETALLSALSEIAAKIVASCTLPLNQTPANPNLVNVYIDERPVANDATNGWSLSGSTVTLLGATCDRVMSGRALDIRVIEGCPTVGPK